MPIHLILKDRLDTKNQNFITFKSLKKFLKTVIAGDFINSIFPDDIDEEDKLEQFLVSKVFRGPI